LDNSDNCPHGVLITLPPWLVGGSQPARFPRPDACLGTHKPPAVGKYPFEALLREPAIFLDLLNAVLQLLYSRSKASSAALCELWRACMGDAHSWKAWEA